MNQFFTNNKYEKYLPSKKFIIVFSVALVLLLVGIALFFIKSKKTFIPVKDNTALAVQNQTVSDLIESDIDGDGVPDWEEALWGTDKNNKNTFDMPDSTYIQNKKLELSAGQTIDENKLSETDKFAREFFSGYTAMAASGQVDPNNINGFSNALGQKIVNPELEDTYKESDIKINIDDNGNSTEAKFKYYAEVQKLFQTYQADGIGDELDIVNSGLATGATNTPDSYNKLITISNAYNTFAKKLMELTVPSELATLHLQVANSSNNTGIAVMNMAKVIKDPLVGLQGLSQYEKYSEDLVKSAGDLGTAIAQS